MSAKGNDRNSGYERVANDWYIEPRWSVDALLAVETFDSTILDPACGSGNIPIACRVRGLAAVGSDLVERGYGMRRDFLSEWTAWDGAIITNPPYGLAEKFALHAIEIGASKVCMIVRAMFLESAGRYERLYKPHPPARVWQFVSRVSMPPGGMEVTASNGSISYCWIVWERAHSGPTTLGWLP